MPYLTGCPHLPGYDLHPNLVSNTSTYSSLPAANVTDLSALCSADPQCLAFTTWGDLKSGLMNYTDWSLIDSNWVFGGLPVLLSCQGMYVKVLVSSAGGAALGSMSTPPKASMVVSPPPTLFSSPSQSGSPQVFTLLSWRVPDNWTVQGSRLVFSVEFSNVVFLPTSPVNQSVGIALAAATYLVDTPSVRSAWSLPTLTAVNSGVPDEGSSINATWLDMYMVPNQTLQLQASQRSELVAFTAQVGERARVAVASQGGCSCCCAWRVHVTGWL